MFGRVILPLVETALGLSGKVVKPCLNLFCGGLEWCAKWTR